MEETHMLSSSQHFLKMPLRFMVAASRLEFAPAL
jgi:hypothetical protein